MAEFHLIISGTKNGEWQGTIQKENGEPLAFESMLELLKAIRNGLAPDGSPLHM